MSQRTETKKRRVIYAVDEDKKPVYKKKGGLDIRGYRPAQPREYHEFKSPATGKVVGVHISPGQVINMYKYEKRRKRKDQRGTPFSRKRGMSA